MDCIKSPRFFVIKIMWVLSNTTKKILKTKCILRLVKGLYCIMFSNKSVRFACIIAKSLMFSCIIFTKKESVM